MTIEFPFPKLNRVRGDAGEILLVIADVPQIIVKMPEAVPVETERREDAEKK